MGDSQYSQRLRPILGGTVILAVAILVVVAFYGSKTRMLRPGLGDVLDKVLKKNELVSTMRINLHASVEAEKSAVLADTDETSRQFADQAAEASRAVEQARKALGHLIETGQVSQEMEILREFNNCWERFQEIDRTLLPLAVQNTNLKALSLSFGPASAALKRMELAIGALIAGNSSSAEAPQIVKLSFEALTAAIKIHASQAPHIAEVNDAKMDEMEAAMGSYDHEVNDALDHLGAMIDKNSRPSLDTARAAYQEFKELNVEVIRLSRENSNVRSLSLSLGQKRKVTAQCEERLSALQDAVQSTGFKATK